VDAGGEIARLGELTAPRGWSPVVRYDEALKALRRLTQAELEVALRERVFPVAWSPHAVLLAAGGRGAAERAWQRGQMIAAHVPPEDCLRALQRLCRPTLLREAIGGLRRRAPSFSAHRRLTGAQEAIAGMLVIAVAYGAWRWPTGSALAASCFFALFFLAVIALRVLSLLPQPAPPRTRPLRESDLPQYTVLVPLFRETSVLSQLLTALDHLDYPRHKLDIKLVLEEGDIRMRRACARLYLPEHIEIILVPASLPQTKPKALAYALPFARGELLTIFDAEDVPDPHQLRQAAAAFAAAPPHMVCLQASLSFYNPNENWLTRGIMAQTPQARGLGHDHL
jgi:hypothetical protein